MKQDTVYYVVTIGRKKGIYTKWEECKKQVDGYKYAKYKKYSKKEDAEKAFKDGVEYKDDLKKLLKAQKERNKA